MKRVMLVVSYDGTNYHGWQIQANAKAVEEVLNQALADLLKEPVQVIGASRTDSGVHALGNVAVFDTSTRMPADKIYLALNQRLPQDIRIQSSKEVPLDWHPRKQNCIKTYEYQIWNYKIDQPLIRLYSHFCYVPLDLGQMQAAAAYLIGEHDFKSFCTTRTVVEETVRTIYQIDITKEGHLIRIRVSGNGFLYNMVRIIVGTLIKVGTGAYSPAYLEQILDQKNRSSAGPKIPAKGLTLVELQYETKLAPFLEGQNKYWDYILWQDQTRAEACLIIRRADDQELAGVLRRVLHQAYRNRIQTTYVIDCEKDRIEINDQYGYYHVDKEVEGNLILQNWSDQLKKESKMVQECLVNPNKQWYCVYNQ